MRNFLLTLATVTTVLLASSSTALAWNPFQSACSDANAANSTVCTTQATCNATTGGCNPIAGPNGILIKVVHIIAFAAGAASVIVILIGGFLYITSNGDAGKITTAKNTVVYALVGLVVIIVSQTVIAFVITKLG